MRRLVQVHLLLLLLLLETTAVPAQTVRQMADLNTGPNGFLTGGMGNEAVVFDGRLTFVATDRLHGTELWISDGTALNTVRLSDICPGQCSSSPNSLYVEGSNLYFSANDGRLGFELWRLQSGSLVPTLVADINPGAEGSSPAGFVRRSFSIGGGSVTRTFFAATRASEGREVWRLSANVPTLERDVAPGTASSDPRSFVLMATLQIGFTAVTPGASREVYQLGYNTSADPAAVSAIAVGGFNISSNRSVRPDMVVLGSSAYAIVDDSSTFTDDLYATNGTTAGTIKLRTTSTLNNLTINIALNRVFFTSRAGSLETLAVTDGTVAGTVSLGTTNIEPRAMTSLGNRLFFAGLTASNGRELFSSDGTVAGTGLFKELVPGVDGMSINIFGRTSANNQRAYFTTGDQLWITDGVAANTQEVSGSAIAGTGGKITALIATSGQNVMLGFDPSGTGSQGEPFFSNGTAAGTLALGNLISDIGDSFPTPLADIGNRLVFVASVPGQTSNTYSLPITGNSTLESLGSSSGVHAGQHFGKLWLRSFDGILQTDGTTTGTSSLSSVRPEAFAPECVVTRAGVPHFLGVSTSDSSNVQIWSSDGTNAGTVPVTSLPVQPGIGINDSCFTNFRLISGFGDSIFVTGVLPTTTNAGFELLRLDSNNQLSLVLDLRAGATGADIRDMVSLDDRILFVANDGIFGQELWRSTGTAQGTVRLSDINPGAGGANITLMTRAGNRLYFVATTPSTGTELYVSDGSAAGTGLVADLFAGSGSGLISSSLLVASGNTLFFTGTSSTEPGCRLFRTEGNSASCAYDATTTSLGPILDAVVTASGAVVFTAVRTGPSDGEEIRVLFNGQVVNVPGTNLGPGTVGSAPSELVAAGENVFFRANDSQSGFELWQLTLPDLALVFRDSFE